MPTLHVVIPFYNEGRTLARSVQRVLEAALPDGWDTALVLVDDHSDGTHHETARELVRQLEERGARYTLRRHEANRGKGAALATGFDLVLADGTPDDDLVIIHDADLEYDPRDFRNLMTPLIGGEADAVIGSRWLGGPPPGLKRTIHAKGNQTLTWISNVMTGYKVSDMECCYKIMFVGLLRRVRAGLTECRYGVEPQLLAVLSRLDARVAEVAVSYDPRSNEEGKKIRWTDGARAIYVIVRERLRSNARKGPPA